MPAERAGGGTARRASWPTTSVATWQAGRSWRGRSVGRSGLAVVPAQSVAGRGGHESSDGYPDSRRRGDPGSVDVPGPARPRSYRQRDRTEAALAEAERHRTMAQDRLWESLAEQGRSQRLAGQRWAAIAALGEAAKIKPSDELRQEAIEAVTTMGFRQRYFIPFGRASGPPTASGPTSHPARRFTCPPTISRLASPTTATKTRFTADSVSFSDDSC